MGFPPPPAYPLAIDSERTLFKVYNTTETRLAADNEPWSDTIVIVPANDVEIWSEYGGFGNIEGELFYYESVEYNDAGMICKLKNCARNIGGEHTKWNPEGTWVRGFVIAEHHNQLVDAIHALEAFVIEVTDKVEILYPENDCNDDFNCADVIFSFDVDNSNNCDGTTVLYNVQIVGKYTSYKIDFGDGNSSTELSGTYVYPTNTEMRPVVTVTNDKCTVVQTHVTTGGDTPPPLTPPPPTVPVPSLPELPTIVCPECYNPDIPFKFPPIVFPCIELGDISIPAWDIHIPSIIDVNIPSIEFPSIVITIDVDVPSIIFPPIDINFPSLDWAIDISIPTFIGMSNIYIPTFIDFGTMPSIPTFIDFGTLPTLPTFIDFGTLPSLPTFIDFGHVEIPTFIGISFMQISFLQVNIPTFIDFGNFPCDIPTFINFGDIPTIPTFISFGDLPTLPTFISFDRIIVPTIISFQAPCNIPTSIEFNNCQEIPTFIDFGTPSLPTFIEIKGCNLSDISMIIPSMHDISLIVPSLHDISMIIPSLHDISMIIPSMHDISLIVPPLHDISLIVPPITVPDISVVVPNIPDIHVVVPSIPDIHVTVPSIPDINIKAPSLPDINVNWGNIPDLSGTITVVCQKGGTSFIGGGREPLMDDFQDRFNDVRATIETGELGIPSIITVEVPKIPHIKVVHDIPVQIKVQVPDIPDIRITGPIIPSEIKVIHTSPIPETIMVVATDLPSAIRLQLDTFNLPVAMELKPSSNLPTTILVDGGSIPTIIQVRGVPSTIELIHNLPKEIVLTAPENLEIPLAYRGGPIPVQFDIKNLTGEDGSDAPCFALVPCPRK